MPALQLLAHVCSLACTRAPCQQLPACHGTLVHSLLAPTCCAGRPAAAAAASDSKPCRPAAVGAVAYSAFESHANYYEESPLFVYAMRASGGGGARRSGRPAGWGGVGRWEKPIELGEEPAPTPACSLLTTLSPPCPCPMPPRRTRRSEASPLRRGGSSSSELQSSRRLAACRPRLELGACCPGSWAHAACRPAATVCACRLPPATPSPPPQSAAAAGFTLDNLGGVWIADRTLADPDWLWVPTPANVKHLPNLTEIQALPPAVRRHAALPLGGAAEGAGRGSGGRGRHGRHRRPARAGKSHPPILPYAPLATMCAAVPLPGRRSGHGGTGLCSQATGAPR